MSDTTHLALPYLEAAQAQKHVTVNEALRRLDAVVQLTVKSRVIDTPPGSPAEGDRYIVAADATGDWADADGSIAVWSDGAWIMVVPVTGWRAFDDGADEFVYFNGTNWASEPGGSGVASAHGAATNFHVLEGDHTFTSGATNETSFVIPDRAIVLGVTGRVLTSLTGATTWSVGVAADSSRYGSGIGVSEGSTVLGPSGPLTYWAATPLLLTAAGSDFTGGVARLAIHYVTLTGPGV